MSDNIHIKLPDGSDKEFPQGTTAFDVAKSISPRLAEAAIAAKPQAADFRLSMSRPRKYHQIVPRTPQAVNA